MQVAVAINDEVAGARWLEPKAWCQVSIIVPMRNEEQRIGACLDSILRNGYPPELIEILVVDGDSTDRSCEVVRERMLSVPNVCLLQNASKQVPAGLNIAIRQARGRYILRMDAHCEYPTDYISTCVAELERTGAANVGGSLITLPGADSWIARGIALLTQHPVGVGNSAFRLGRGDQYVDTVPFGAFRRKVFDEVGLFREDLVRNQDYEFNSRLRAAGYKIYLSSKIQNKYFNSSTMSRFMRQAISNGVWGARCWMRYPESFCWRHAAPFTFFASLVFLLVGGLLYQPAWLLALLIGAIYSCALFFAGLQIAIRNNWRYAFLVPVLIAIYHICYGASTAWGFGSEFASSPWGSAANESNAAKESGSTSRGSYEC